MRQKDLATLINKEFSVELSQSAILEIHLSCASGSFGTLTVLETQRICEKKNRNPNMTQKQLAELAKLQQNLAKTSTQPTISNILTRKRELMEIGTVKGKATKRHVHIRFP